MQTNRLWCWQASKQDCHCHYFYLYESYYNASMEISVSQAVRLVLLMKNWCKEPVRSVTGTGWGSDINHISTAGREHAASCTGQHKSWTGHRWQQCRAWDIPHAGGGAGRGPPMEERKWTQGHADPQAREYTLSQTSSMPATCLNVSVWVVLPCLKVGIKTGFQFIQIHPTPLISTMLTDNFLHVCPFSVLGNKINRIKITLL